MNPFDRNNPVCEILANLNILIYSMDQNGQYLFMGQQCDTFTGYRADAYVENDRKWVDSVHPADLAHYKKQRSLLSDRGTINFQYRFICRDGTVKWFKDTATAVMDADNGLVRTDGTIQDISAQRAIEKEQELIRSAINSANNGILIVDAQHPIMPIIFANHAFEELTGYTLAEVIGKNCSMLQKVTGTRKHCTLSERPLNNLQKPMWC